jgi:apolipoprotein N-acyltransferase
LFLGVFYWILQVPKYTWLHHVLLALYLGSYFGLFGFTFNFVSTHWGINQGLFSAPFLWVSLEYLRSNFSFLALPWALLAHSQYQYPPVIQIASLTGTYSISFLIVLANAALAGMVLSFKGGGEKRGLKRSRGGLREMKYLLVTAASLLLFALVYGSLTITNTITGNKVKISLVQGNIEQAKKWDPKYAGEIMRTYAELTREASKEKPDLIIWPETAAPGSIGLDQNLDREVRTIVKEASIPLLLGSAHPQKFVKQEGYPPHYYNSAYMIFPPLDGRNDQRYDKIRLFPFGEYLPYDHLLPWSLLNVMHSGHYVAGKEFKVINHPSFRFGVTICWENIFPDLFQKSVDQGAQFIVNITNEAHFGKTAAPYQLASISVFRAVENRVFVVRCANTGISCIIDPYGRIVDRIRDEKGLDIFVRGIMSGWIVPLQSKTIFLRIGNPLVLGSLVASSIFLISSCFKVKRRDSLVLKPEEKEGRNENVL